MLIQCHCGIIFPATMGGVSSGMMPHVCSRAIPFSTDVIMIGVPCLSTSSLEGCFHLYSILWLRSAFVIVDSCLLTSRVCLDRSAYI